MEHVLQASATHGFDKTCCSFFYVSRLQAITNVKPLLDFEYRVKVRILIILLHNPIYILESFTIYLLIIVCIQSIKSKERDTIGRHKSQSQKSLRLKFTAKGLSYSIKLQQSFCCHHLSLLSSTVKLL
ncbi:hypothetical protein GGGNBK_06780 [Sporosarcina sp. ANT_H38]